MFATYARMMLHGEQPYVAFDDIHPPLTHYYWVLVEALAGTDWSRTCAGAWGTFVPQPCVNLLAHVFDLALTLVTAGLVYAIARRLQLRPLTASSARSGGVVRQRVDDQYGGQYADEADAGAVHAGRLRLPQSFTRGSPWLGDPGRRGGVAGRADQAASAGDARRARRVQHSRAVPRRRRTSRRVILGLALGWPPCWCPPLVFFAASGALAGFWTSRGLQRRALCGWLLAVVGGSDVARDAHRQIASDAAGLLFVGAVLGGLALWLGPARANQRLPAGLGHLQPGGDRRLPTSSPRSWRRWRCSRRWASAGLWDDAGRDGLGLAAR